LLGLFTLFLLQIFTSQRSRRYIWIEERIEALGDVLSGDELPQNILEPRPLESAGLEAPLKRYKERYEAWSIWTTRIYITITLSSAGAAFISLVLPCPPYFVLLLIGMSFASAYIFSRTWRKEED